MLITLLDWVQYRCKALMMWINSNYPERQLLAHSCRLRLGIQTAAFDPMYGHSALLGSAVSATEFPRKADKISLPW